jgi:cobalamin biosynthesis Mg chelatase CobN
MMTYDYGETEAFEAFITKMRERGCLVIAVDIHYGHTTYTFSAESDFTKDEINEMLDLFLNKDLMQFEVDGRVAKVSAKTRRLLYIEEPKAGFFRSLFDCFKSK